MYPQRLPAVDGDDGTWGDILRKYLEKEHFNDDTDNAANGGHQNVTIRAGVAGAGGAPLKFTSGTLLSTPEAGAVEFAGDNLYVTQTSSTTRKKVALYDDASGATGDIYYRNSSGYFARLAVGTGGQLLSVASGVPSWGTLSNVPLSALSSAAYSTAPTASVLAQRDTSANLSANAFLPNTTTTATSGGVTNLTVSSAQVQIFTGTSKHTVVLPSTSIIAGMQYTIINNSTGAITVNASGGGSFGALSNTFVATLTALTAAPTTTTGWNVNLGGANLGPPFSDAFALVRNNSDATKRAIFSAASITSGATRTYILPDTDTTVAGTDAIQTLTNKRMTPRIGTTASSATPTVDTNSYDQYNITALAVAITSWTISGTPTDGQKLMLRIKDNGSARALAWPSSFRVIGVTLPTTTVASKTHYIGIIYNSADSKWDVLAVGTET